MKAILNYKTPYLYLTGLTLLVCGLPVSLFLTSLSQFFLAGSFLLEGDVREKFKRFFSNKVAVFIAGVWLMHLIGMLWTTDLAEGIKDLRIKLPLLILPLIIGGSAPLSEKQFKGIMTAFITAVLIGSLSAIFVLAGIIHREIHDIRDVFIFHISHIRFGLFTCVAISTLFYYTFYKKELKGIYKSLSILLMCWFFVFLVLVESLTGLSVMITVLLSALAYELIYHKNRYYKFGFFTLLILIPVLIGIYVGSVFQEYRSKGQEKIDVNEKTANGNDYIFMLNEPQTENGYLVNVYLCQKELRKAWNERSTIDYDSLDHRGQKIYGTIIRFLTSKGLRKDSVGIYTLSPDEIKSIENGIANVHFQHGFVLRDRIMEVIWELDQLRHGEDPSGHSVAQRYEFWKAAVGIISANPIFGVGTGDLPFAFQSQYEMMNTKLDLNYRLRSHNQYLSIGVAFGLLGLIYFLIAFFMSFRFRKQLNALFFFYFMICALSMLTEDTLETQPGATFVGFFLIFFFVHCRTHQDSDKTLQVSE